MNNLEDKTDEALMDLLQKRSSGALEELYLRYSKRLLSLMYRMLQCNEELAQDLLHDVFLKLIEKPEQFDTSKRFKPWIYTVVANACRKTFREKQSIDINTIENLVMTESKPEQELYNQAFRNSLHLALSELSYEHREVFVLKHQQELSIKEIASILHCAEGTIKSRLYTTRKILSEKLKIFNPK